jgi:ribose/xylose/arabinose/galactoside ABC-type transport system permease subunit
LTVIGGPSLVVTLSMLGLAFAIAVLANLQMRRPYERRIHGVPWLVIQFVAVAICFVMAAHLVSLLMGRELESNRLGY